MSLRFQPAIAKFGTAHNRKHLRARLAIEAWVDTVDGTKSGLPLNLSCSGAMFQAPDPPKWNSCLLLRWGPLVLGTVVWNEHERVGNKFDELADQEVVVSLRRIADQAALDRRHGRPTLRTGPLTRAEWEIAREWSESIHWR